MRNIKRIQQDKEKRKGGRGMKIADVVITVSVDAEIKNLLGEKEVSEKESIKRLCQMISQAMNDTYLKDQPTGEENRQ